MKSLEKQFYLNTKKYFPDCTIDTSKVVIKILDNEKYLIELSYETRKLMGNDILEYYLKISLREIEEQWLIYREELMYPMSYPATLFITIENFAPDFFQFQGLNLSSFKNDKFENIFDKIHVDYTNPLIEKFSNIGEVDKIINPLDKQVPNVIRTSAVYPLRAVLVAKLANNPRLPEIINDMRNYCQDSYQMGIKDNYIPATKLLPVFEKMFGKE